VVDFVREVSEKTGTSRNTIIGWTGLTSGKYYDWKKRYGSENRHNGRVPRDWWLAPWEKQAIVDYFIEHPMEGYRRLTYMMMDDDIVAVSPATVYRVLKSHDLLGVRHWRPSKKGTGFVQPLRAHEHWHVDICYLNIDGTFYYMCTVIDGCSRYIVHWEIRESMKALDVEIIIERAREKFPEARPRIISDNGPQFIAKDFKEYIRISGMTHVRTSPYYPQSNGKVERVQKTVKTETIRKRAPRNLAEAIRSVGGYVEHYNNHRLHSAIGYVAPVDKLNGKQEQILRERERKLEQARARRKDAAAGRRVA
jgi:transposase InsO family protein